MFDNISDLNNFSNIKDGYKQKRSIDKISKKDEDEKDDDKETGPTMKLIKERQILISDQINSKMAYKVMKQLLIMNAQNKEAPITIIINSPGGEMYSGFGIYDMIKFIDAPVRTVICGLAASMGSIISLAPEKKNRFATFNSKIMIHQPLLSGIMGGSIADIEIEAKEMLNLKRRVVEIYHESTGQDADIIKKAIERNTWMTATEAAKFGHISKVVNKISDLK